MQLWRSCSAVPKVDIEFRVTPSQESKLIITAVWPHLTTTLYPRFHPPARLMSANEVTLLVKPGFATRLRALASFGQLPPSSSSAQPKAQCLRRLGLAVLGLMSRQCSLPVQAAAGRNPAAPRARLEADPPPPLASAAPSARCRPPPSSPVRRGRRRRGRRLETSPRCSNRPSRRRLCCCDARDPWDARHIAPDPLSTQGARSTEHTGRPIH